MGVGNLRYSELLPVKRGDSWRFGISIAIRVSGYSAQEGGAQEYGQGQTAFTMGFVWQILRALVTRATK
jgi:hypothetical protein